MSIDWIYVGCPDKICPLDSLYITAAHYVCIECKSQIKKDEIVLSPRLQITKIKNWLPNRLKSIKRVAYTVGQSVPSELSIDSIVLSDLKNVRRPRGGSNSRSPPSVVGTLRTAHIFAKNSIIYSWQGRTTCHAGGSLLLNFPSFILKNL